MLDPFVAGLDYLYGLRALLPDPSLIGIVEDLDNRYRVCSGIGRHIAAVNHRLQDCVSACDSCFHPWQRRSIQIWAAPFADAFALDGLCLLHTRPLSILVDVGRVIPEDWLALVVHEYAHAHLASPGHSNQFAQTLLHLCHGLSLETVSPPNSPEQWQSFPPLRYSSHPLDFWQALL